MKKIIDGRTILAAALVLGAALPARAASADDAFGAALGELRQAFLGRTAAARKNPLFHPTTQEKGPNDPILLMQKPMIDLVKKVEPSVVFLVMDIPADSACDPKKSHCAAADMTPPQAEKPAPTPMPGPKGPKKKGGQALCTGFFVDSSKYMNRPSLIATNSHCVEKLAVGAEIGVGLYDGNDNYPKMTKGKVLAYGSSDAAKDIAFVELADASLNRPPLPLWWKLDVGEQVVAIGNPLGMTFSVSKGIISALERDNLHGQFVMDQNQSDVAVNPGNSGGPLFNMWGSVVGINSMIASQSGGFEGISLSLPANYIAEAMKQYARTGDLKIGALQISLGADKDGQKIIVQGVEAGGPAASKLQPQDEIVRVDGVDVAGLPREKAQKAFLAHVKYMSPGEKTTVTVLRGGKETTVEVTLGVPKPPEPPRPEWAPIPPKPKAGAKDGPASYTFNL